MSEDEAIEMEKLFEYLENEHADVKYNKQVCLRSKFFYLKQKFYPPYFYNLSEYLFVTAKIQNAWKMQEAT